MSKSASITDVLDSVIGISANNGHGPPPPALFLPSAKFSGSKPNYVFRNGDDGVGYYLDPNAHHRAAHHAVDEPDQKRPRIDNGTPSAAASTARSVRFDPTRNETQSIPPRIRPTGEQLLAQAEEQQQQQQYSTRKQMMDISSSKSVAAHANALLRTADKNSLLRAQHPDDPSKFMMNEVMLHDEIVSFKNAAVDVSSYECLVDSGVVSIFGRLLMHENSDVGISVVGVLTELLDGSLLDDDGEQQQQQDKEEMMQKRIRCMGLLAHAFLDEGGMESLANNLGRFDETVEEDARGVEDALTLIESLLDLDRSGVLSTENQNDNNDAESSSAVVDSICKTLLLSWLFQRVEKENDNSENDSAVAASNPISPALIRLHASEVLSTILQHEDYSMKRCGLKLSALPEYTSAFDDEDTKQPAATKTNGSETNNNVDGMEILLVSIAAYRKSDPRVEVECEFLENMFDALAASLLRPDNVQDFVEKEGIQLMLRCVREKVHSGGGALKVVNFALAGSSSIESSSNGNDGLNVYKHACEVFVQAGGFKSIFPLYMARKSAIPSPAACSEGGSDLAKRAITKSNEISKRAKRALHARKKWWAEVEQNVINIMYSLTRYIDSESKYDSYSRLMAKFVEEDCEKCDRTIELCLKYDEKARIAEYQYFRSDEAEEAEELGRDVDVAALGAKLRGGGDIFHRLCSILSFICVGSNRGHGHVREQMKLQGTSISVIKEGLTEFASLLVDGAQKAQIEHYLSSI